MSRSTAVKQYPLTPEDVTKTKQVVVVDIDKALPESKAELVRTSVVGYCEALEKLEPEYKALVEAETQVYSASSAKKAGVLRRKYVKLRGSNGSEGTRKVLKDDSLLEGRVIDGVFGKVRDAAKDREEQLKEIEEYIEREEKRIQDENQMDRYRELEGYILKEDELHQKLGLMTDERWEEYFLEVRNAFQAHEEKIAKEKLANDRMNEAAPYSLLIPDYSAINWAELKEKRFKAILDEAKDKWDKQEKERLKAQAKAKEQEELEERFRKRLSLLTGCTLGEKGAYYKNNIVLTVREIKEHTEENFAKLLFKHLEVYTKDQEEEKAKKDAEMELIRKQESEKAKLEAARHLDEQKKREEEQRIKSEEERLMALKNSTDGELLRKYAVEWSKLLIPVCVSEEGKTVERKLRGMVDRGIEWINANTEKI